MLASQEEGDDAKNGNAIRKKIKCQQLGQGGRLIAVAATLGAAGSIPAEL
jgi:hypothetical protein